MQTLKEVYDAFKATLSQPVSERETEPVGSFAELLGADAGPLYGISHDIFHIKRVWIPDSARSGLHVLVTGESGSGKSVVTRLLRAAVESAAGREIPVVRVNCSTLTPDAAEAGLLDKHSATFSSVERQGGGWFRQAAGGLLVLEEIADLPDPVLARLAERMAGAASGPDAVRVVAATRRYGDLRVDLRWRFPERIHVPPVRRRRLDIFFVLNGLLRDQAAAGSAPPEEWLITPGTLLNLLFGRWRGNVGELRNVVDAAVARYRTAPPKVPRFLTCRVAADDPDVLTSPKARYDLWRRMARFVREVPRGRDLVPAEPPERAEVRDYGVLRSFGSDDIVPCLTCAEALEFATLVYEQLDEDGGVYEHPEARVYTAEAARPPLPPTMRWQYDAEGNARREEDRWAVDFSGMTSEQAYVAYLTGLRERCGSMAEAVQKSGLSDSTLRRHFKEHGIRQYKGKRPSKSG